MGNQPEAVGGASVTQVGAGAPACEHRRELSGLDGEDGAGQQVDATMDAPKSPDLEPVADRARADPAGEQLPAGEDAVLAGRKAHQGAFVGTRAGSCLHIRHKPTGVIAAPQAPLWPPPPAPRRSAPRRPRRASAPPLARTTLRPKTTRCPPRPRCSASSSASGSPLLPVFVIGLLAGPTWAAIALLGEIGIAIGFLWRRRRERAATAAANGAGEAEGGDQAERA